MIIHQLEKPRGILYDYDYRDAELISHDIDYLLDLGIEEIWYWYQSAPYEGAGEILMRIGNVYALDDLGHCSCNRPTELVVFTALSFYELENSRSERLKVRTDVLFDAARPSTKPDWEV